MPKKPSKPDRSSEYSPIHRQNVLLEDMSKKFDHFGEGLTDVQEKVSHIPSIIQRIENVEGKLTLLEVAVGRANRELSILKSDVSLLKSDVSTIKSTFATKKDIEAISTRLTAVESR